MRHNKKAAVPASKAKIGEIYGVMHGGKLTRFRVDRVTIHRDREDGSPHDYTSEITGYFIFSLGKDHDARTVKATNAGGTRTEKATIRPDMLLGKYEEYKDLIAQEQAEKEVKEAQEIAARNRALELRSVLYNVAGLPMPNDPKEWKQPFKIGGYTAQDQIDISTDAVAPLLAGLERLIKGEPIVKREIIDLQAIEEEGND